MNSSSNGLSPFRPGDRGDGCCTACMSASSESSRKWSFFLFLLCWRRSRCDRTHSWSADMLSLLLQLSGGGSLCGTTSFASYPMQVGGCTCIRSVIMPPGHRSGRAWRGVWRAVREMECFNAAVYARTRLSSRRSSKWNLAARQGGTKDGGGDRGMHDGRCKGSRDPADGEARRCSKLSSPSNPSRASGFQVPGRYAAYGIE